MIMRVAYRDTLGTNKARGLKKRFSYEDFPENCQDF
jgi:hypothetical protein